MKSAPLVFVENVLKFDECERDVSGRMYRKDLAAGSGHWTGDLHGNDFSALDFVCPCGCGTVHCLPVAKGVKLDGNWLWDGNEEKPTLTPSIQCTTACRWHGYLTNGIFVPC